MTLVHSCLAGHAHVKKAAREKMLARLIPLISIIFTLQRVTSPRVESSLDSSIDSLFRCKKILQGPLICTKHTRLYFKRRTKRKLYRAKFTNMTRRDSGVIYIYIYIVCVEPQKPRRDTFGRKLRVRVFAARLQARYRRCWGSWRRSDLS